MLKFINNQKANPFTLLFTTSWVFFLTHRLVLDFFICGLYFIYNKTFVSQRRLNNTLDQTFYIEMWMDYRKNSYERRVYESVPRPPLEPILG